MRRLLRGTAIGVASAMLTAAAMMFAVGWTIGARPGEWSVPLRVTAAFGVRIDAGVASLLRVALHPFAVRLLDGRSFASRAGTLRITRSTDGGVAIECRPCRLQHAAFGPKALHVASLRITARPDGDRLEGTIASGAIAGRYVGRFDSNGMTVDVRFDAASIASYYGLFAEDVPEVAFATIAGTAAADVQLSLPSGTVSIAPTIDGFAVSGLGTKRIAGPMPSVSCGIAGSDFGFWLPRAVVAAEDQRYYQHPGYDLDEVTASLARNQSADRAARGASTIPQQLAKLLFAGSERSASRKLREALYAAEMERTLGKARMLQLYLTIVPWGEGTCGAEAAARHYFGVAATRLDGAQAVWLAAMLHAPDREADRWAAGGIDVARATRIASGLRGVRSGARARMIDRLETMAGIARAVPAAAVVVAADRRR